MSRGRRCVTTDVDLEALARGYDHRPASATTTRRAAQALRGLGLDGWAIDVGGGRGDHASRWAATGFRAIVLDPSKRMVTAAACRQGVSAVRGHAQAMPFCDGDVTLVYFHLSIHYGDWKAALREAHRVLTPGGRCVVWTLGARHHRASMLTRWFPSVGDIDVARFPDPQEVAAYLGLLGESVETGRETETVSRTAAGWRAAVEAGFVSTLQLIGGAERSAGLAAFGEAHPDPDEKVRYAMRWDWIRATRER